MKILIYNGHEFSVGGGEKYALYLAKVLEGYGEITFAYSGNFEPKKIKRIFGINLRKVKFININRPDIKRFYSIYTRLLRDHFRKKEAKYISKLSSNFDLFIASGHWNNPLQVKPRAKRSIFICHSISRLQKIHPYETKFNKKSFLGKMYTLPYESISNYFFSPLTSFHINDYDIIIANSRYCKKKIKYYWKMDSKILYPPVIIPTTKRKKKNIIVSMGRFARSKRLLEMIKAFKSLSNDYISEWEYYIIVPKPSSSHQREYLKSMQKEIQSTNSIYIFQDLLTKKIQDYLSVAKIFWNLAGLSKNENEYYSKLDHFGMVNIEAMAHRCVPLIFNGGGHKEIIQNRKNGFLVNNTEELIEKTLKLIKDEKLRKKMADKTFERAKNFSFKKFRNRLFNILEVKNNS